MDESRLLAARSELGYTTRPAEALRGEPEAVPRAEQQRQSLLAELRGLWRRLHRLGDEVKRLEAELRRLEEEVHSGRRP